MVVRAPGVICRNCIGVEYCLVYLRGSEKTSSAHWSLRHEAQRFLRHRRRDPGPSTGLGLVDALPTWNATPTKQAIVEFVGRVSKPGGPDFVAPAGVSRRSTTLEGNKKALAELGEHDLVQLIMVTHAGMTADEFSKIVTDWLATARHTRFRRPYTELVYQPMLELLSYPRANGFKTFIVSGAVLSSCARGPRRYMVFHPNRWSDPRSRPNSRCATESAAIGSRFCRLKTGKPIASNEAIGRRPIAAFGNSDGDLMEHFSTSVPFG
jgi:hypothetical protein